MCNNNQHSVDTLYTPLLKLLARQSPTGTSLLPAWLVSPFHLSDCSAFKETHIYIIRLDQVVETCLKYSVPKISLPSSYQQLQHQPNLQLRLPETYISSPIPLSLHQPPNSRQNRLNLLYTKFSGTPSGSISTSFLSPLLCPRCTLVCIPFRPSEHPSLPPSTPLAPLKLSVKSTPQTLSCVNYYKHYTIPTHEKKYSLFTRLSYLSNSSFQSLMKRLKRI
jgi:hypothetical protein